MKQFIISTDLLRQAFKKLAQAINKKSTLPILENLYCKVSPGNVILITSDLELTVYCECPCESKDTFQILIPFEFIQKVVALSGSQPLSIQMNGRTGKIIGEIDEYELGSLEKVEDFPNLPELPKQKFISLNGSFMDWLKKAQMTCGKDDLRPAMTMICLDIFSNAVTLASTDAHFAFTHSFPVESKHEDQLLISTKIAKALDGFASTEIYWHKQHIAFKSEGVTIIATRHEERFPDYKAIFPGYEHNLVLDRKAVIEALERACLNTSLSINTTLIYLKKEPGTIHFESIDMDLNRKIKVDIPGSFHGSLDQIAINAEKLLTLMLQVDYSEVRFHLAGSDKAILLTSESDPDYKALLMPLLINQ